MFFINYFSKKYRVVAYNNRMYKDFRFVGDEIRTLIGAKLWIGEKGDRTRYLYNIFNVENETLVWDFSELFNDYERVKNIILKTSPIYSEPLINLIFNFKNKWNTIHYNSISIYFEDLMAIYQAQMDQYTKKYNNAEKLLENANINHRAV